MYTKLYVGWCIIVRFIYLTKPSLSQKRFLIFLFFAYQFILLWGILHSFMSFFHLLYFQSGRRFKLYLLTVIKLTFFMFFKFMEFVDFLFQLFTALLYLLSICLIPLLDIMISFLWSSEFVAFIFALISSFTAHAQQALGHWTKCRPCNYSASSSWWLAVSFSPRLPPSRTLDNEILPGVARERLWKKSGVRYVSHRAELVCSHLWHAQSYKGIEGLNGFVLYRNLTLTPIWICFAKGPAMPVLSP